MKQKLILAGIITLIFISTFCILFSQEDELLKKAQIAIEENRFEEAIISLNKIITKSPKSYYALYNRGICYLYTENTDKALADFNKVISINPKFADAYNTRGLLRAFKDEYEKAISDFDKAIELDPKFGRAYFSRGNIYLTMNNSEKALADYDKAVQYDKENPAIYHQRGGIYYMLNKLQEAIDDYSKAISKGIRNNKIYFNRANAYFRTEKYDLAINDYTKAIELDSNDRDALNNRAMAYEKSGKSELANNDRKIYAGKFGAAHYPSVDSIKLTTYKSKSGEFSIDLPEGWNIIDTLTDKFYEIYITPNKMKNVNDYYTVGVKLSLNKYISKFYDTPKEANALLEFWKQSSRANAKDYYYYTVLNEKVFPKRGEYYTAQNHIQFQQKTDSPQLELYEYVMTKDDLIFYSYYQSLSSEWGFYQALFDKAIKTLKLNVN